MKTLAMRRVCVLVLLGGGLSACQSAAPQEGSPSAGPLDPAPLWIRSSAPRFVTLGRSTTYALVHRAGQDLLIVEDPVVEAGGEDAVGRLTWIVTVPETMKFDTPIEVGGPGSESWLLEQVWSGQGHATPATGTVIVHHRDADILSASLHMRALGEPPVAGQAERATIDLDRKFDFARHVVTTPQYREMGPRSGIGKPKAE